MQMRAGLVAILVTTVVVWLLSGLFWMVLAGDMMMKAMEPYAAVMNDMMAVPMYMWALVVLFPSILLMRILTLPAGLIPIGRGVMMGVTMSLCICISMELSHSLMFKYHDWTMSLISCAWDAFQWAIGGAVMAWMYNKLYKAA